MSVYPVRDRRGLKTFKLQLVRQSLLNASGIDIFDDIELEFSEIPSRVILQKSAVYNDTAVPGRSEPWKTYSHSNPATVNFTAKLVAMGAPLSGSIGIAAASLLTTLGFAGLSAAGARSSVRVAPPTTPGASGLSQGTNTALRTATGLANSVKNIPMILLEVQRRADWLRSLTYPQYDEQGRAFPPPLVDLIHGANFTLRGVVKDVRLVYQGPWEPVTLLSQVVEASITFEEVNETPKSYLEIRQGWNPLQGGLRRFQPDARDILSLSRSVAGL